MIPGISILVFVLSAASDSEGESEETWAERFARCDAIREKYRIPLLTAKERMSILLGQHRISTDNPPSHLVGYYWSSGEWIVALYKKKPIFSRIPYHKGESISRSSIWKTVWKISIGVASDIPVQKVQDKALGIARELLLGFDDRVCPDDLVGFQWDENVQWPW